MNPLESGNMPPQSNEEKPRFAVGAKKNPDGTWDYSRAMELPDPDGRIAKEFEDLKNKEKEARAKRLEIPEDVKPGSAEMTWYTMRNTILVNKEVVNKERKEGKKFDKRREDLIKAQEMQQTLFSKVKDRFSLDLIRGGLNTGESITAEEALERESSLTANEMYDLVQKYVIDHYESLEDEGKEEAFWYDGYLYPIKELLRVARDLQSRLLDEATRGEKK